MNFLKKSKLILTIFIFCLSFLSFAPVEAKNLKDSFVTNGQGNTDILDNTSSQAGYDTGVESGGTDLYRTFSTVISFALSFLGVIFFILLLYGGFLWMSDQGNEEQVKKAKDLISAAIIGLIIVLSAYAISWFIINAFGSASLE